MAKKPYARPQLVKRDLLPAVTAEKKQLSERVAKPG
jgi:hypothetical protein